MSQEEVLDFSACPDGKSECDMKSKCHRCGEHACDECGDTCEDGPCHEEGIINENEDYHCKACIKIVKKDEKIWHKKIHGFQSFELMSQKTCEIINNKIEKWKVILESQEAERTRTS